MRYAFGILFVLFFAGFVACTVLLGFPPVQVYESRDILLAGALGCAALSAVALGLLVLGVGSRDKKISSWGVPLLCVVALLVCFGFGVLILIASPVDITAEHAALNSRLRVCVFTMVLFGLFSLGGLILTLRRSKRHNSNLAPPAAYPPSLQQSSVQANIKRCPTCGNTYTDVTLRYCLIDGSSLEYTAGSTAPYDAGATIKFNDKGDDRLAPTLQYQPETRDDKGKV